MSAARNRSSADRRLSMRRHTHVATVLKDARGSALHGTIVDISEDGCSVAVNRGKLLLERMYSIKFAGLEAQAGFIAWTHDGKAGMQFAAPLYPAVVDNIVSRFPPSEERTKASTLNGDEIEGGEVPAPPRESTAGN